MEFREIIGNTTATPNPRPDWAQTDSTKADFIKNKPNIGTSISCGFAISAQAPELDENDQPTGKGIYTISTVQFNGTEREGILKDTETAINELIQVLSQTDASGNPITLKYSIYLPGSTSNNYTHGIYNLSKIEGVFYDSETDTGIIMVSDYQTKHVLDSEGDNVAENIRTNYLTVVGYPELGNIEVGFDAIAIGKEAWAHERGAIALGAYTRALGMHSVAEGYNTFSTGARAHAEGSKTEASFTAAHAEGQETKATKQAAHAEGYASRATGPYSHTEGALTKAQDQGAHAEGYDTLASKAWSHAEGDRTQAIAESAHSEGRQTVAKALASHAEGRGTVATVEAQHVEGKYNIEDTEKKYAHIVGNGKENAPSNAHTLDWSGNAWYAGDIVANETSLQETATVAEEAKSIASEAQEIANGAQTTAGEAKTAANKAQTTADSAKSTANEKPGKKYYVTNEDGSQTYKGDVMNAGGGNRATGTLSFAAGYHSYADRDFAMALGAENSVSGYAGAAIGLGHIVNKDYVVAVGRYSDPDDIAAKNAIFVVGKGGSNSTRSNAMVITKDGKGYVNNKEILTSGMPNVVIGSNYESVNDAIFTVGNGNSESEPSNAFAVKKDGTGYLGDKKILVEGDILDNYSKGLAYTLNEDGESYSVTGLGTCTNTNLIIPASYEGKPVTSIGNEAFKNCKSLTSATIPRSVTSIGDNAFRYCNSLTNVDIPDSVTSIGENAFDTCKSLMSITIPNSVTSMGWYVFSACKSLTSVVIPDSMTSIVRGAFAGCDNLISVTIPRSVTSIGPYAFNNCKGLMNVDIPDSVTSIEDSAFMLCKSLTSVEIPDSVTSIGSSAFFDCESLTIYCEATEQPADWDSKWNSSNRPVVWNYIMDFDGANEAIDEINTKLSGDLTPTSITTNTITIGNTAFTEGQLIKILNFIETVEIGGNA